MEELIATYEERRLWIHRTFELFTNHIRVAGKGIYIGRFDTMVPLSALCLPPGRTWIRGPFFRYGLIILFIAACWASGGLIAGGMEVFEGRMWQVVVLAAATWIGIMFLIASFRRIEFVQFFSPVGVLALDISKIESRSTEFEEFVQLLVSQVELSRRST